MNSTKSLVLGLLLVGLLTAVGVGGAGGTQSIWQKIWKKGVELIFTGLAVSSVDKGMDAITGDKKALPPPPPATVPQTLPAALPPATVQSGDAGVGQTLIIVGGIIMAIGAIGSCLTCFYVMISKKVRGNRQEVV